MGQLVDTGKEPRRCLIQSYYTFDRAERYEARCSSIQLPISALARWFLRRNLATFRLPIQENKGVSRCKRERANVGPSLTLIDGRGRYEIDSLFPITLGGVPRGRVFRSPHHDEKRGVARRADWFLEWFGCRVRLPTSQAANTGKGSC